MSKTTVVGPGRRGAIGGRGVLGCERVRQILDFDELTKERAGAVAIVPLHEVDGATSELPADLRDGRDPDGPIISESERRFLLYTIWPDE